MLFQEVSEVTAQTVQKSGEAVFLGFSFLLLWLRCFLLSGGTVRCLLQNQGAGFSIVPNVSRWTLGPCFSSLRGIQAPAQASFLQGSAASQESSLKSLATETLQHISPHPVPA